MKKFIFAALATLISTGAFAQKFEYGVKAGLNLAKVTKLKDSKMRMGLAAGVFGEYAVNDFLGLQVELLYSQQGVKGKTEQESAAGITAKTTLTEKLNYINLPVLAKFYVLDRLSVDLGPQFGYMVSAKQKIKITISGIPAGSEKPADGYVNGTTTDSDNIYDEEETRKFDISFGMGLTYKLNLGIDVFARYNLGLTKIMSDEKNNKHGVISIGAGYRF